MSLLRIGPRARRQGRDWLRPRVGLAIRSSSLRAVGVRGDAVRWTLEAALEAGEDLGPALAEFLGRSPAARHWPRPRVTLALPPGLAQVKRVAGLPNTTDPRLLAAVVRGSPERFFLRYGGFLVTGGVRLETPGVAWAAAYDGRTVADVAEACRRTGMRLDVVLPTVAVLGRATCAERIVWVEGPRTVEVFFGSDRRLADARRSRTAPESVDTSAFPAPVEQLARLGVEAGRFADAYGAATHIDPLEHRPGAGGQGTPTPLPRWRLTAAAVAALLGGATAATAPGVAAVRWRHSAEAELRTVARPHAKATAAAREMDEATASLTELAAFDGHGRSVSAFLASLAGAMPERSAIVAVRVDSIGGQIVTVSPSAAAVVSALERVSAIASPEITGPVTREGVIGTAPLPNVSYPGPTPPSTFATTNGAPAAVSGDVTMLPELERVAVRFRFRAAAGPSGQRAERPTRNSP